MAELTSHNKLTTGEVGIIKRVQGTSRFKRRLVEMGFLKEVAVLVKKFAPLRDPGEYVINGCHVAIRKIEAADILMERIAP